MINDAKLIVASDSLFLPPDLKAELSDMLPELQKTWDTAQIFRTETEMRLSVLNDAVFPTPDSKYWQSVREQKAMLGELLRSFYEHKKLMLEIRRQQRMKEETDDDIERDACDNEIWWLEFQARNMEQVAADRMRELRMWSLLKAEQIPDMKHGTDNVEAHQPLSMLLRYNNEAKNVTPHTPPNDARNILMHQKAASEFLKVNGKK